MKVHEVILRAMAKKISWWQAAEIIGISDRPMRSPLKPALAILFKLRLIELSLNLINPWKAHSLLRVRIRHEPFPNGATAQILRAQQRHADIEA